MRIIADSGSTKTDWCLLTQEKYYSIKTIGINPYYQTTDEIIDSLQTDFSSVDETIESIYFYGAGCANPQKNIIVEKALTAIFGTTNININSDLLGAARSLCQAEEGIACILGTGSNSCYYKDGEIAKNVSPLGYRLGDEGSGAVIGEKLVSDILKNQLSETITKMFFDMYKTTSDEIIENVYRRKFPNRYLAQFTKFIHENIHIAELEEIVLFCFNDFVKRNLMQYEKINFLPVHFTGSVAYHFRNQLHQILDKYKLKLGNITQSPMDGLVIYHKNH